MPNSLQHILCIDDESDILEVAKMCLETIGGLQVTCLNSGAEAVAKAEAIQPDIIMLDVMMPEMDGPSTLKKLRENPALNHIPIVFMTARVQPSEVQEYMAMGAAGVVPKPFDPMLITAQVTEIWNKSKGK
ncbi:MAG TPA: response regulator [Alphaproteobacteria bacterium]|nr:hypothetical protein [Rhodospirillaceae bacterium]HRJ11788.1 response regulator [Alphaproteobacteria bacterium]